MTTKELTLIEKTILLDIARSAIQKTTTNQSPDCIDLNELPDALRKQRASFVTLTKKGALRGCIGALVPYQSLALDVQEHAIAAALHDYRFPKVTSPELSEIRIEISCLTIPVDLNYSDPSDLLSKLRPNIDGVILEYGHRKATFLPQVWESLPKPPVFLSQLCLKMGAQPELWKTKPIDVKVYQVEKFHE